MDLLLYLRFAADGPTAVGVVGVGVYPQRKTRVGCRRISSASKPVLTSSPPSPKTSALPRTSTPHACQGRNTFSACANVLVLRSQYLSLSARFLRRFGDRLRAVVVVAKDLDDIETSSGFCIG